MIRNLSLCLNDFLPIYVFINLPLVFLFQNFSISEDFSPCFLATFFYTKARQYFFALDSSNFTHHLSNFGDLLSNFFQVSNNFINPLDNLTHILNILALISNNFKHLLNTCFFRFAHEEYSTIFFFRLPFGSTFKCATCLTFKTFILILLIAAWMLHHLLTNPFSRATTK